MTAQTKKIDQFFRIPAQAVHFIHKLLIMVFPPGPNLRRTDNVYVETLGLAGLFLFLANISLSGDLYEYGETMLLVAFFLAWRHWGKVLVRQPLFWLMIAFAFSILISKYMGMTHFPQSRHLSETKTVIRLCLFVPLAWWIGANALSIRNAFIIVCLGFLVYSLSWLPDQEILSLVLDGGRPRGVQPADLGPRPYSVWIGFLVLGTGILGRHLLPEYLKSGKKIFLGSAIIALVMGCLILMLFALQGRASWIAVAVTLPVGLIVRHFFIQPRGQMNLENLLIPVTVLLLVFIFFVGNFEKIKNRFAREIPNMTRVITGKIDEVESSSLGVRVQMGLWVLQGEPGISFFGWGPRSVQAISRTEELREKYGWNFKYRHLHSDYSAILFRYGIFGFSVVTLILFSLIIQVYSGYRKKRIPDDLYVFFMMSMAYILIVSVSNIVLRVDAFTGFIGGLMFASILISRSNASNFQEFRE